MKKIIPILIAAMFCFSACKNSTPKDSFTITSKDGKETVSIDPNNLQDAAQNLQKQKEELSKLTPLTTDELKALLPETLMGTPRTNFEVNSAMGAGLASGKYKKDDDTKLSVSIYDCAGPAGAGIYSMQFLGMYNMQQEDDDEYTKTIDFNGGKAFENCKKTRNECTLTYFSGDRFLITLEGDNIGIDELKQAAKELNIK